MKLNSVAFCGCALLIEVALAGVAHAQAFVGQATPPGGGSVYVDQVPPGARPRVSQAPVVRPAPRRQTATAKAAIVEEVAAAARLVPTVGAGSSAVIKSTTSDDWPSVGAGTVRK